MLEAADTLAYFVQISSPHPRAHGAGSSTLLAGVKCKASVQIIYRQGARLASRLRPFDVILLKEK